MRTYKKPPHARCISLSSSFSPLASHATAATLPRSHLRLRRRPLLLFPCRLDLYIPKYDQESRFVHCLERI